MAKKKRKKQIYKYHYKPKKRENPLKRGSRLTGYSEAGSKLIDEEYRRWRKVILCRDKHCKFPGCLETKKLQCHHIIKWADCPYLRFEVDNGIALCKNHHSFINKKETIYAPMFMAMIIQYKKDEINKLNIKKDNI